MTRTQKQSEAHREKMQRKKAQRADEYQQRKAEQSILLSGDEDAINKFLEERIQW